jgi:diguanylate cyclase (GGDEF)-like protein
MKNITEIINTTKKNLQKRNILATPLNFEREFYLLYKKTDLILEECVEFDEIIETLSPDEKKLYNEKKIQTFKDLAHVLNNRITDHDVKKFLNDLSFYMGPSINKESTEYITKACIKIAENPNSLIDSKQLRMLREITNNRIKDDTSLFNEKTTDVRKLIVFLGEYFNKTINQNCVTIEEVIDIKKDIKSLKLSPSSKKELKELKSELLTIIEKFEKKVDDDRNEIIKRKSQNKFLYEQIEELQSSLTKAEEEKSIDYLTGLLTRRAYILGLDKIEEKFRVFDSNYALIFYDIDHFKNINDTYGHDCGDFILKTFASILQKLTRTEDIIVRYGGEEFVSLVHYSDEVDVANYIKRVKNIITKNKFVYGKSKIDIKFSAGVTFRNKYESYDDAIKEADNLLYKAKEEGRNKIILDSNIVL